MRQLIARVVRVGIFCVLSSAALYGQLDTIATKFVPRSHPLGTGSLLYRLFIPDGYTPEQKYPLVLTMGGTGADGTDNLKQVLRNPGAEFWAYPYNQKKHPCFVLAPQIQWNQEWFDDEIAPLISSLLDSLAREFPIDTNRLYLSGFSKGGTGAWGLMVRFPGRFAAALPAAAGWDARQASSMINTAIWCAIGALDGNVPDSRAIIDSLRALGREAVYTNCHNKDCSGLPDSMVSMYIMSHADLFYTEAYFTDHAGGDVLIDNPNVIEWVFDKYRITPGSITITSPSSYTGLTGIETVTWISSVAEDSVEIWYSPDAGRFWQLITRSVPNAGSYQWDTRGVRDATFGRLKIFVKNQNGFIYGHDQSGLFRVDNASQGTFFVRILNEEFATSTLFDKDTLTLRILAGNSRGEPVAVRLFSSFDGGHQFEQFGSFVTETTGLPLVRTISIGSLVNSDVEVLKVEAGDGVNVASDVTYPFAKRTPRLRGPGSQHLSGRGGGIVIVNVVDSTSLTGNLYRVFFNDAVPGHKYYDVVNVTRGVTVVAGATQLNGKAEGPLFDGIRLLVTDHDPAVADTGGTKWEVGPPSPLAVTIILPGVLAPGGGVVKGIPYAADYSMEFFDHVVDTSSDAILGKPRIPIEFTVTNVTENRHTQIIYVDGDKNGQLSNRDEVYLIEPDSSGSARLAWEFLIRGVSPAVTPPRPGDRFVFRTLKPFRSGDVYEFNGVISSVPERPLPAGFSLSQNFPNPFNPKTVVSSQLPVASDVRIVIYDLLGREVAVLVNEWRAAGGYRDAFDGSRLASGVYFCRMTAGSYVQTRRMLLIR